MSKPNPATSKKAAPYETGTCPKCRGDQVSFWFCDGEDECSMSNVTTEFAGEHLHNKCDRCGFEYLAHCMDHKEPGKKGGKK